MFARTSSETSDGSFPIDEPQALAGNASCPLARVRVVAAAGRTADVGQAHLAREPGDELAAVERPAGDADVGILVASRVDVVAEDHVAVREVIREPLEVIGEGWPSAVGDDRRVLFLCQGRLCGRRRRSRGRRSH
jgi:hypothetical protein